MSLISVFRVEHKEDGTGPFAGYYCVPKVLNHIMKDYDRFPGPFADNIRGLTDHHLFGCRTLELLLDWMAPAKTKKGRKECLKALKEKDFVVREYIVPEKSVKDGKSKRQTVFKKNCHNSVQTHDISILRDVAKEQQLI